MVVALDLAPRAGVPLASPEQARSAVARRAERGGGFVKVVVDRIPQDSPRIDLAALAALVEETHRRGIRAAAHTDRKRD